MIYFVRVSNHMVLTPRAEQLQLGWILSCLTSPTCFRVDNFNPRDTEMHFRFAAADFVTQLFFPVLCTSLFNDAPGLRIDATAWSGQTLHDLGRETGLCFRRCRLCVNGHLSGGVGPVHLCMCNEFPKSSQDHAGYLQPGPCSTNVRGIWKNPLIVLWQLGRQRNVVIPHASFHVGARYSCANASGYGGSKHWRWPHRCTTR